MHTKTHRPEPAKPSAAKIGFGPRKRARVSVGLLFTQMGFGFGPSWRKSGCFPRFGVPGFPKDPGGLGPSGAPDDGGLGGPGHGHARGPGEQQASSSKP